MPNFSLHYGTYGTQTLTDGESGVIGSTAVINATNAVGVDGSSTFGGMSLAVYGAIYSTFTHGVVMSGGRQTIFVGAQGEIQGNISGGAFYAGIVLSNAQDGSTITNAGTINGGGQAIYFHSAATAANISVTNTGLISSVFSGILFAGGAISAPPTASVLNAGQIVGTNTGITSLEFTALDIINSGLLQASGNAIAASLGTIADKVRNSGEIYGNIELYFGNDTFDNRGGTVEGSINLGDGDDTLFLGASVEVANGGAGLKDAIDVTTGAGGVIDLTDEGRGTGLALGDTLLGFERVYGSKSGVDTVYGNTASNLIYTYGGNDVIFADLGADAIYAGRGADTITGGAGNDTFGYQFINEFGDTITDFSSTGSGNDDRFTFRASNLGGGLVAGPLDPTKFQARADNVADANDRFIFRTTDTTLWLDVDGAGGVAPVMVADLQAGATVTAADIILV